MNLLDGVLLLCGLLSLLLGWRLGLVCGMASLFAIAAGSALGFTAGRLIAHVTEVEKPQQVLIVMACTIGGIALAQLAAVRPSQRLHDTLARTRLRHLNNIGGSALVFGFAVMIVWMLATALALAPSTGLASLMRGSAVLAGLDRTVPGDAGPLLQRLETSSGLASSGRVFTGLGLLPAPEVELPSPTDVSESSVRAASESVVRIMGHAICGTTLAGSGIVVGEDLVLTNAHVVAGVPAPIVFASDRRIGTPAEPVYFDAESDIALLRVTGLGLPALNIVPQAATGDLVAVAGYPDAGPLKVRSARVRGPVTATGTDVYGVSQVQRSILVLAADVIPGDSGGALLSPQGDVVGVIFAAALDAEGHTAYALSADEAAAAVEAGSNAATTSTGTCVAAPS